VPVLVVQGDADRILPFPNTGKRLPGLIKDMQVVVVQGGPRTGDVGLTELPLWRLTTKLRAAVDRVLAPLGLTHAEYTLLASLYGHSRTGAQPSQRELVDSKREHPVSSCRWFGVCQRREAGRRGRPRAQLHRGRLLAMTPPGPPLKQAVPRRGVYGPRT
jgi:hypothetical protein